MPEQSIVQSRLPKLVLSILGGSAFLVTLMVLAWLVSSQQIRTGELAYLAILGGLGGFLVGRNRLECKNLSSRFEDHMQHIQDLYRYTPAMILTTDQEGRLIRVSQSCLDCLGYDRRTIIGQNFFDLLNADDSALLKKQYFDNLREHRSLKNIRYELKHANGGTIDISLTAVAIFSKGQELVQSMAVLSDLANVRTIEERIERLAYYDTLTGLPNRTLLIDRMVQSTAQARRDNRQVGVFFFDLDRFKMINDTQGHATGDLVLRSVAQRLKKFIREGDTFARLGGDEFVIIQADPNHDPNFNTMARRILEMFNEPFHLGDREFFTTASIGVAVYPLDGTDPQTLLKSADTAMYVAKSRGRNNFQFFSGEMNASALTKSSIENKLRKALLQNNLQQHYQVQIDLTSGKIIGIEALLRWQDSQGNPVPPDETIQVAEETGLIYPLGEWTLKKACVQAKEWLDQGFDINRIAVNLSGYHIRQVNFIDQLEQILNDTGLSANHLEIELAETSVMDQVNDIIMALTDLKVRGIHLAIDDFGIGYSSLLHLMHLPVHRIKVAMEFITGIDIHEDYKAITEAIIAMARSLKLKVSAVGVENAAQVNFLQQQGCNEAQGNYFSEVLSADQMTLLLKNNKPFPIHATANLSCELNPDP